MKIKNKKIYIYPNLILLLNKNKIYIYPNSRAGSRANKLNILSSSSINIEVDSSLTRAARERYDSFAALVQSR